MKRSDQLKLVVDTNIVMAALIAPNGSTRELLFSDGLDLYAPNQLLDELKRYENDILQKSKLTHEEYLVLLELLQQIIHFTDQNQFEPFVELVSKNCPDPNDVEFLALAISLNCPLWTNDKKLSQQKVCCPELKTSLDFIRLTRDRVIFSPSLRTPLWAFACDRYTNSCEVERYCKTLRLDQDLQNDQSNPAS